MINVIPRWVAGPPAQFKAGQFIVYESGEYELIGSFTSLTKMQKILKHTTLIEGHELEWLQSMAVDRSLGVKK